MVYVISDIHGNLHGFKQLLHSVDFDFSKDLLYVLGDTLDRGKDGIAILWYLLPYIKNGTCRHLAGNHEIFCRDFLSGKLDARKWISYGGEHTLREIFMLTERDKKTLLSLLENMPFFAEECSPYVGKCLLSHTGALSVDDYAINHDGTINVKASHMRALNDDFYHAMLCGDDVFQIPARDVRSFDRFWIFGHIPVFRLPEGGNTIYRRMKYMDIDTGSGFEDLGGRLCIYCMDTDTVEYW